MSRVGWRGALILVVVASVLGACAAQYPSDPTIVERLCKQGCEHRTSCKLAADEADCEHNCISRRGPWDIRPKDAAVKYLRPEYADAIIHCVGSVDCSVLADEGATMKQCVYDTRPPPSDLARRFCRQVERKIGECGGGKLTWECDKTMSLANDGVLTELLHCAEISGCRSIGPCLREFRAEMRE